MKLIHTADWHLGKLLQGVYLTEDQAFILQQFTAAVEQEKPDAVIIAGDLYDRAIPPLEAVDLLNRTLEDIVLRLGVPVLAISGNHDSPDRLDFGTKLFAGQGLHLAGRLRLPLEPVVLADAHGEVHVHLVPYADPAQVRTLLGDDTIRSHDDAMRAITAHIAETMDAKARHVFVGHAFVTPGGEARENTSDSERPLSIGGAEHVQAAHFQPFHYTALGHLHQAHYAGSETVRYAGSLFKYSASEASHQKGYYIVQIDEAGQVQVEKRTLQPKRDVRLVEAYIEEIASHERSDDYVFVTLLNDSPVLHPMEKVRTVYPNALHVSRKIDLRTNRQFDDDHASRVQSRELDPLALFRSFYEEIGYQALSEEKQALFAQVLDELRKEEEGAV